MAWRLSTTDLRRRRGPKLPAVAPSNCSPTLGTAALNLKFRHFPDCERSLPAMRKETSGGAQALPDRSPSVVARSPRMDMASQPAPRARGVSAMLRRSLSFMLTGLLIAVPLLLTAYAAQTDWTPHKTVLIAVSF